MGRRKAALNEAIMMLIEVGKISMNEYDYDEWSDNGFTRENVEEAYLLILKKMGLLK